MLLEGLEALDLRDQTSIVIVSDHGQAAHRAASDAFVLDDVIELDGLTVIDHASYASIFMNPFDSSRAIHIRDAINAAWTNGRAYLRTDAPAHWRVSDSPRFADIIVMAEPGYAVLSTADKAHLVKAGDHGWDPAAAAMGGIFLAVGPGLPAGLQIGEIAAVDVRPLLLRLLELPHQGRNDSRWDALTRALQDQAASP